MSRAQSSSEAKRDNSELLGGQAVKELPTVPKVLIGQPASGPMRAEARNATAMAFKKALLERVIPAEMSHHLGYGLTVIAEFCSKGRVCSARRAKTAKTSPGVRYTLETLAALGFSADLAKSGTSA